MNSLRKEKKERITGLVSDSEQQEFVILPSHLDFEGNSREFEFDIVKFDGSRQSAIIPLDELN